MKGKKKISSMITIITLLIMSTIIIIGKIKNSDDDKFFTVTEVKTGRGSKSVLDYGDKTALNGVKVNCTDEKSSVNRRPELHPLDYVGSTATVALLSKRGIAVANVGDSRALLFRADYAKLKGTSDDRRLLVLRKGAECVNNFCTCGVCSYVAAAAKALEANTTAFPYSTDSSSRRLNRADLLSEGGCRSPSSVSAVTMGSVVPSASVISLNDFEDDGDTRNSIFNINNIIRRSSDKNNGREASANINSNTNGSSAYSLLKSQPSSLIAPIPLFVAPLSQVAGGMRPVPLLPCHSFVTSTASPALSTPLFTPQIGPGALNIKPSSFFNPSASFSNLLPQLQFSASFSSTNGIVLGSCRHPGVPKEMEPDDCSGVIVTTGGGGSDTAKGVDKDPLCDIDVTNYDSNVSPYGLTIPSSLECEGSGNYSLANLDPFSTSATSNLAAVASLKPQRCSTGLLPINTRLMAIDNESCNITGTNVEPSASAFGSPLFPLYKDNKFSTCYCTTTLASCGGRAYNDSFFLEQIKLEQKKPQQAFNNNFKDKNNDFNTLNSTITELPKYLAKSDININNVNNNSDNNIIKNDNSGKCVNKEAINQTKIYSIPYTSVMPISSLSSYFAGEEELRQKADRSVSMAANSLIIFQTTDHRPRSYRERKRLFDLENSTMFEKYINKRRNIRSERSRYWGGNCSDNLNRDSNIKSDGTYKNKYLDVTTNTNDREYFNYNNRNEKVEIKEKGNSDFNVNICSNSINNNDNTSHLKVYSPIFVSSLSEQRQQQEMISSPSHFSSTHSPFITKECQNSMNDTDNLFEVNNINNFSFDNFNENGDKTSCYFRDEKNTDYNGNVNVYNQFGGDDINNTTSTNRQAPLPLPPTTLVTLDGRLEGKLGVSRSLGDYNLKCMSNERNVEQNVPKDDDNNNKENCLYKKVINGYDKALPSHLSFITDITTTTEGGLSRSPTLQPSTTLSDQLLPLTRKSQDIVNNGYYDDFDNNKSYNNYKSHISLFRSSRLTNDGEDSREFAQAGTDLISTVSPASDGCPPSPSTSPDVYPTKANFLSVTESENKNNGNRSERKEDDYLLKKSIINKVEPMVEILGNVDYRKEQKATWKSNYGDNDTNKVPTNVTVTNRDNISNIYKYKDICGNYFNYNNLISSLSSFDINNNTGNSTKCNSPAVSISNVMGSTSGLFSGSTSDLFSGSTINSNHVGPMSNVADVYFYPRGKELAALSYGSFNNRIVGSSAGSNISTNNCNAFVDDINRGSSNYIDNTSNSTCSIGSKGTGAINNSVKNRSDKVVYSGVYSPIEVSESVKELTTPLILLTASDGLWDSFKSSAAVIEYVLSHPSMQFYLRSLKPPDNSDNYNVAVSGKAIGFYANDCSDSSTGALCRPTTPVSEPAQKVVDDLVSHAIHCLGGEDNVTVILSVIQPSLVL